MYYILSGAKTHSLLENNPTNVIVMANFIHIETPDYFWADWLTDIMVQISYWAELQENNHLQNVLFCYFRYYFGLFSLTAVMITVAHQKNMLYIEIRINDRAVDF